MNIRDFQVLGLIGVGGAKEVEVCKGRERIRETVTHQLT